MQKPAYERHGDSFFLTWQDKGIAFGINRLNDKGFYGLQGYLTVEAITAETRGIAFGPVILGLENVKGQREMADTLAERVNGMDKSTWLTLVAQACSKVSQEWRAGSPTVDLRDLAADAGPVQFMWDRLIPLNETTILYGDGESAKSLIALMLSVSHSLGLPTPWGPAPAVGKVMYLDFETNGKTVASRLRRICAGMGVSVPSILYRQCKRSIHDELPSIIEDISRKNISLVVCDSIGFAVTGSLVDDDTARQAISALRQMECTRLVIGHVSADTAKNPTNKASPFGSRFFWNGMREGLEIRRAKEGTNGDDDVIDLGIYPRKGNDGPKHRDLALRVAFDGLAGPIAFDEQDLIDVPDLAQGQSMPTRLRQMLKRGKASLIELAEAVDSTPDKVRTTLNRMPDTIALEPGGGKGHPSVWGLKVQGE